MKNLVFALILISSLIFEQNYLVGQNIASKKGQNNYLHLKSDFEQQINKLSEDRVVFLYVHSNTCHFCKTVAPVVKQLTKKYTEALFIKVDIEKARGLLKDRYRINGTPNLMLIYNGNIASSQYQIVNTTREESIVKWAEQVYPTLKHLPNYKNITCISAFNYKQLMTGNQYVLYRGNARLDEEYTKNINLVYQLAKKYPNYKFGITSGQIPYGQEIDNKYASVYRRFSIISNIENIKAKLEPYGATPNMHDVSIWIDKNMKNKAIDKIEKKDNLVIDINKKSNYLHLKSNFKQQINKLSEDKVVFLYVHSNTCHFCKTVAPVVEKLTKKYPDALFVKIDIENARTFLKERYRISGTPNLMLIYNGNIASSQYQIVNTSREESIVKWAEQVYPTLKKLQNHRNIDCITAFNYKKLMGGNQYILYRGNARLGEEYTKNISLVYQLAKKYHNYKFGITSGQVPYGQEIDNKYARVYRRFSIIDNIEIIEAKLEPYGATPSLQEVSLWIENNK